MRNAARDDRSAPLSMQALLLQALLLALVMSLVSGFAARAQVINYPNGFAGSSNQIWLENAAVLSGSVIQMTQSGVTNEANNVWFKTPVNVQAFTTTFTFATACPSDCGDGFGFMILSVSNPSSAGYNYSGFSGSQFSWSQCGGTGNTVCAAINSILVKFDLYDEQNNASGVNHTGFYSGGTYPQPPNNPEYDMAGSGIDMEGGDLMRVTLTYDGTVLTETVTDTVTNAVYSKTYTANIPSLVGGNTAYVGFGAGTGAASATQNLKSWTYTVQSPGEAAIPAFSPAAGTYFGSQTVALSSASSGAVICENTTGSPATNGAAGCNAGTLYMAPLAVSSNETIYAVAGGTGYSDSPVVSASYAIQSSVATPTFSPGGGTYAVTQSVTISEATANAIVYYTTDGTTPSASSTKYTGPITVNANETLKAIAVSGSTTGPVASAAYTITSPTSVATPVFSPVAGTYTAAQSVTISDATSGATIYYTTDGTTPTASSTRYSGPITVGSTETLKAIAVVTGNISSAVASAAYTIHLEPSVATPVFSPAGGAYTGTQTVTISDATPDATIYYTTDGSTPTTSSAAYSGPITVKSTETLKAIAVAAGDNNSAVAFAAYNITQPPTAATPVFAPGGGTYTSAQSVTITDSTAGATIYYTADGTVPTSSSTRYAGPIAVNTTETLQAIAVVAGDTNSAVASAVYTIAVVPVVATPTFSPAAGTYTTAQSVTIADATAGATIYYTTDGTTPTTASTAYTGPVTVSTSETLQAIAAAAGENNSAVASAVYTITPPASFTMQASPAELTVNSGSQGTVTLTVTPVNGFSSAVSFACSGLPSGATCTFAPATVTPAGGAATTQLTIAAAAQSSALPMTPRSLFPFSALALSVCFFGWGRRGMHRMLVLCLLFVGAGMLFGCGGGGSSSSPPPTTPTHATVTVTATSGMLQATANIALTLN